MSGLDCSRRHTQRPKHYLPTYYQCISNKIKFPTVQFANFFHRVNRKGWEKFKQNAGVQGDFSFAAGFRHVLVRPFVRTPLAPHRSNRRYHTFHCHRTITYCRVLARPFTVNIYISGTTWAFAVWVAIRTPKTFPENNDFIRLLIYLIWHLKDTIWKRNELIRFLRVSIFLWYFSRSFSEDFWCHCSNVEPPQHQPHWPKTFCLPGHYCTICIQFTIVLFALNTQRSTWFFFGRP